MLKVLVVDDEPLAHDVIAHHCRGESDLEIVGHCLSAAEARARLDREPVDLLFLDMRMPVQGGLDFLRGLAAPPLTVVISAHQEFALDGFELDVVDYLLKPVSAARFAAALAKVRRRLAPRSGQASDPAAIVLKVDRALRRISLDSIACCEAEGNFVRVSGQEGIFLATTTLKALAAGLPDAQFVQIHRSFIVNRSRIAGQHRDHVVLDDGRTIPVGRQFRHVRLLDQASGEQL